MGIKVVPGVNDMATTHPGLAAQLVHPEEATRYMAGSTHPLEWRCDKDPRHVWTAKPVKRSREGQGCPYCAGRKVMVGVNDLSSARPDLASELLDPEDGHKVTASSGRKLRWRCKDHPEHVWESSVCNRVSGKGCPYCAGRKVMVGSNDLASTRPDLAAELADPEDGHRYTVKSNKRVLWCCKEGHEWEAVIASRANGAGCPVCAGQAVEEGVTDLATTHPEIAGMLVDPEDGRRLSYGSKEKLMWRCPEGHVFDSKVSTMVRTNGRCPVCDGRRLVVGITDIATTHPDIVSELVDQSLATQLTRGSNRKVEWRCPEGHTWTASVNERCGTHRTGCPHCWVANKESGREREIGDIVELLVGDEEVVRHDHSVLGRRELDVYVPSRGVAIEFDGVYWHSEKFVPDKNYARDKTMDCLRAGVRLVRVWDDDWDLRRQACVAMLASKLGASDRLGLVDGIDPRLAERISARSCSVREVSGHDAHAFLKAHHVQGGVRATLHFGLYDETGALRALLSARDASASPRCRRDDGTWEVQRYATCGIVRGGFSKLLKAAEGLILGSGRPLSKWVSFSDGSVSDGGLYEKCGFVVEAELGPDYRYAGEATHWRRMPKERFQKKRFRDDDDLVYEEGWTESQCAAANGLVRVWDAGKTRWAKQVR